MLVLREAAHFTNAADDGVQERGEDLPMKRATGFVDFDIELGVVNFDKGFGGDDDGAVDGGHYHLAPGADLDKFDVDSGAQLVQIPLAVFGDGGAERECWDAVDDGELSELVFGGGENVAGAAHRVDDGAELFGGLDGGLTGDA